MVKLELNGISLDDNSRKKFDDRYVKIVSDVAPKRFKKFISCRRFVEKGHCEGRGHLYFRGSHCRLRDLCPIDAAGFSIDQAQDAYDVMNLRAVRFDGAPDRVWIGVFTLPKQCWSRIPDNGLKEFRQVGRDTIEEMFSEAGRYRLYYRVDSQFWHGENAFRGWYPHLHVTVSSIAFDNVERRYVRLNLFQADLHLVEKSTMSLTWRGCFKRLYGKVNSKYVNVWWRYREKQAGVLYWIRYSNRNPVADVYKNLEWSLPKENAFSVLRFILFFPPL